MKFVINKAILENILLNIQPFLEKKDNSSPISHIYIKIEDQKIIFKATDYEIGLSVQTDKVNIISDGKATANGKKLLDIIRILKNEDVAIEEKNNNLHITQLKSKYRLNTFNADEYPDFPTNDKKPKFDINSQILVNSLKKITPCIDTNNPKQELTGALISIEHDKISFVATDTRRLSVININKESKDKLSLIIPKKAILEIQKLFFDEIEIYYDETYLIIQNENYYFYTKLINSKFPDFNRIIPKEINFSLDVQKSSMIEAIKQITIISQEIKISVLRDKIKFESMSKDISEAQTEIPHQRSFDQDIIFGINSRYLLDFLSQINTNNFDILINQSNLPFVVQSENFKTIIMPISINN
jgi:DNA polymerase-3 subunit beta